MSTNENGTPAMHPKNLTTINDNEVIIHQFNEDSAENKQVFSDHIEKSVSMNKYVENVAVARISVHKSKMQIPENAITASSVGALLDNEFERLVAEEKFELRFAAEEIYRLNDYGMYWNSIQQKPFNLSEKSIEHAQNRFFERQKQQAFAHFKQLTAYDGITKIDQAVEKVRLLMEPVLVNPKQANIVAFGILHWMWQNKRRVMGESGKNHLAIGFINEGLGKDGQGSGKTTFARNLCAPFLGQPHEDFLFLDTLLSEVTDSRSWQSLLDLACVLLDDVTCESRYDIGTFKSLISAEGKKGTRRLKTHIIDRIKVRLSIIFTANSSNFGQVIKDKTGNRRFLPIMIKNMQGIIPENFDSIPIWKMINHEWECFVNQEMFRELQKEHLTKSNLENLLEMYDVKPCLANAREARNITAKDIKIALNKHFPAERSFDTTQSVTKEMEKLGYVCTHAGGTAKNQTGYFIQFFGNSYERWQANFFRHPSEIDIIQN